MIYCCTIFGNASLDHPISPSDGKINTKGGEGFHQQTEDRTQFWASGIRLKNHLAEMGLDCIFQAIPYFLYYLYSKNAM